MYIKTIRIVNFKNYHKADFVFSPGYNLITGNNGQGKTNVLDAVYMLCMTKSNFQAIDKNLLIEGSDFFRLDSRFQQSDQEIQVVCKFKIPSKKIFEVDGKEIRRFGTHIGKLPIVMIAPGDIDLVEEGSEERRRFLDITISQVDKAYLSDLNNYNKVLIQRNTLLKAINKGNQNKDLLEYYDQALTDLGIKIQLKRKTLTEDLRPIMERTYQTIAGLNEPFVFEYLPNMPDRAGEYLSVIKEVHAKDLILERTTRGVHRDDIEFKIQDRPVRKIGSQGQIKSTIFAAKLSQYEWLKDQKGTKPLLLLDDIFDKLDYERVTNLLRLIDHDAFGQIFITDTYSDRFAELIPSLRKEIKHFKIKQGKVISDGIE